MSTSQAQFLMEVLDLDNHDGISLHKLAYFRERLRNRLHQVILSRFLTLEDSRGFTRADLAHRIGREPTQITRWLGAPGNWTLDTVSDLLLGMASELDFTATFLREKTDIDTPQKPHESLTSMASPPPSSQTIPRSGIANAIAPQR